MAGYFLYTIDNDAFTRLTTSPTKEDGDALADFILEELEDYLDDFDDESDAKMWPADRDGLSALIVKRLALPDWYSDLTYDNANMWDNVLFALQDEPGEQIGLDFQCYDYESIYWDCAEIATEQGASMMAEPTFGSSGFRYFGKPSTEYAVYPMYSLLVPDKAKELLAQLQAVEPYFSSLDEGEGMPREQFFEGLLPPVRSAVENNRALWVQTDT
ncbi:hypothetical protein [Aeoliella sp.]|uniref:hypothetical protein n=1 Tax=Aeoliella sp. TaxID=2795800 RepID=UPI003CCC0621